MANEIALAKIYMPLLDELYKKASLTADLDTAPELIKQGYNANEIVIPMISMSGLGKYSRNDGYVKGDVSLEYETMKCEFDRGRKFSVDDLDDKETGGVAFGKLSGEFLRTRAIPELDAYRFAKYASTENIGLATGTLTTAEQYVSAIRAGLTAMDNDEVPEEGRILYITATGKGLIDDMDTTKSRKLLERFSKIITVPQSRFYTKITQYDGTTEGQTDGGYVKADDGTTINFMIVHPSAVVQGNKQVKPKILSPEVNPDADAWVYGYRLVSIARVYENKLAGIYCHCVADEDPQ